jgi:hypothetical protein
MVGLDGYIVDSDGSARYLVALHTFVSRRAHNATEEEESSSSR